MSVLGKTQKLKRYLEDNGFSFPVEANRGKRTNKKIKFSTIDYLHNLCIHR